MRNDLSRVFDEMLKSSIGLENLLESQRSIATRTTNFPPYNIRRIDDYRYTIELAVAGFSKEDLEIEVEKNVLHIRSQGHDVSGDDGDFIHRGFTYRGFHRTFTLMENVKVEGADLVNGVLEVALVRVIPEEEKPKKIAIGFGTPKQTLLTE